MRLARGAATLWHVGGAGDLALWLAIPSAGLGVLVGAIAGATGRPIAGAGVGAALSAGVLLLFLAPLAYLLGPRVVGELTGRFLIEMTVAGAVGGGLGGLAGSLAGRARGRKHAVEPAPLAD